MSKKREQTLWPQVQPIAERLENSFSMVAMLSAGLVLFDRLTGDEQRDIIAAVRSGELEALYESDAQLRDRVIRILEDLKIYQREKQSRRGVKSSRRA